VWSNLRHTLVLYLVLSYDIMCQYSKHFWPRMQTRFPGSRFLNGLVHFAWLVPKFHLPAHIRKCWEMFNYYYELFTGHTDGEGIERNWSDLNKLAGSVREMGPGSWRDTLDDHMGDLNWRKLIALGECSLHLPVSDGNPAM
jgi:hypothetical protein